MTALITLDHVSKYYRVKGRRRYILEDVSIEVPTNLSVGILGRNGAGKSTTVRIIARAERPNRGTVSWAPGVEVSWPMGFGGAFLSHLSARDNIQLVSRIYGRDWEHILHRVEDFAELGPYIEMPLQTYSSGMRSRFNFAMSVAMDFDCYLFDELMSVADTRFRQKAEKALENLADQSTFVFVSHRNRTIQKFCQCVYVLNDRKLWYFDKVSEGIKYYESL